MTMKKIRTEPIPPTSAHKWVVMYEYVGQIGCRFQVPLSFYRSKKRAEQEMNLMNESKDKYSWYTVENCEVRK